MNCRLTISPGEAGVYQVTLQINGGQGLVAPFKFNPSVGSLVKLFDDLKIPSCPRHQITEIGQQLFQGLMPRELSAKLRSSIAGRSDVEQRERVRLSLVMPSELRWLPWEALFDTSFLHLGVRPDWTIHHEPADDQFPVVNVPVRQDDRLKVLIVVPVQTNLNFTTECTIITRALERLGKDQAGVNKADVKKFEGAVTLQRLRKKLLEGWDIVHYIGHGYNDGEAGVKIMLNDSGEGDEAMVDQGQFASSFINSGVRLVVLNCCCGAAVSVSEKRSLAGFGPYLVQAGVPAVVAMRYEVTDRAATEFSGAFYESLLHSDVGRVHNAVQAGRRALECLTGESDNRAFITPVLFAIQNGLELPIPAVENPAPVIPPPPTPVSAIQLPPLLKDSLKNGDCLIIAGGQLTYLGGNRDAASNKVLPPTLDTLARDLNKKIGKPYPRGDELDAMKNGHDAGAWEVFERFCQYFKSCPDGGRLGLEDFMGGQFTGAPAGAPKPEVFRLMAQWKVPGIVYTHMDGYLREAAARDGDWEIKDNPAQEITGNQRALLLLRGWPRELSTLRLTREDAWDMIKSISQMSSSVKKLARMQKRVVLIIGVDPADWLIQYFVNTLLDDEIQRQERTIFFACAEPEPVVKACWHRFKGLNWLGSQSIEDLISKLDELIPKIR